MNLPPQFDVVYTMTDYYDGPRGGVADFQGRPHIYQCVFPDRGDASESDIFLLQPIDEQLFRLALEDWAIWCRWERAFRAGQTAHETHPALPEDRPLHDQLADLVYGATN